VQRDEAMRAAHQAEALAALSVGKLSTAAAFAQTDKELGCSREEARIAAEAIAAEVRKHHQDGIGPITTSIGVAVFGDDPRTSVATVVSEADTAMYAAKDEGRDKVRVFEHLSVHEDGPGGR
jgi:GGDEF domain-containing protein